MAKYINSSEKGSEVLQELLKFEKTEKDKLNTIQNLYHTEPSEDKTGKELILDAHPEKGEIIPSYHELGGVCENEQTAQDADLAAARRMPDGTTISKKVVAEEELLNELRIIAEEMHIREQNDLEKFSSNLIENVKKKSINKEAWVGMAAIILASAITPLVASWWYSSYSTSSDKRNTGIDNNILQMKEHLNTYNLSLSGVGDEAGQQTGEEISGIVDRLNELSAFIDKLKLSRDTYLKNSSELARRLRDTTNLNVSKVPTSKDVSNNVDNMSADKPTLKPNAKTIIDTINNYNNRYSKYITGTILPKLKEDFQYISAYLKMTQSIEPAKKDPSWWDSVGKWFSSTPELKSEGKQVVEYFSKLITSLEADVQLRELDAKHAINSLSKKIEADISKEFELKKDNTSGQKAQENMEL